MLPPEPDICDRVGCVTAFSPEVVGRLVYTGLVSNGHPVVKLFCSNRCYTTWVLEGEK
jgi:hypothetical protein